MVGGHAHATCIRAVSAIATSAGDGRAAFIDAGDIAQVAVEALLARAALNADLILTGPESLSYDDVAAILTATSGHTITHKRLDPADQPAYYQALGVSEHTARFLVGMDWVTQQWSTARLRQESRMWPLESSTRSRPAQLPPAG